MEGVSLLQFRLQNGAANMVNSFQMVSLLELAQVTEEGVRFLSPHDGTPLYAADPSETFAYS